MSRWFRFYDDAVNDPKVQRLPGEKFKTWVNLLCLASKNGGVLPALTDISYILRLSEDKTSLLLNEFCEKGLLDPIEVEGAPMSYEPHNWNGRQFKSDTDKTAASRAKRYRERRRDDRDASRVTDRDGERPEQNRTEQNAATAPPPPSVDPETELFRRGREVLGKDAGGLIAKLLKAKDGKINLARAAVETAAGKENPREYVGAVIRGKQQADQPQWLDGIEGVL